MTDKKIYPPLRHPSEEDFNPVSIGYSDIADCEYISPINSVIQDSQVTFEDGVYKAVINCDINVDKDELIKALQYDREQHREGFYHGYRSFANRFYSAFREHYKAYEDSALVRMGDIVKLIEDVKNEVDE